MGIDMHDSMLGCTSNKLDPEKVVIETGKSQKGKGKNSAVDKDKKIRDILAGADRSKDGEYGGHAHTSSEINEMLARDEDELAEFERMDTEAAAKRDKDWADRRRNNPKLPEKPSR